MRKGRINNYFKKYYRDYYLISENFYRCSNIESFSKDYLENYIEKMILILRTLLARFRLVKEIEKDNRIYNEDMVDLVPRFVNFSDLYDRDDIKPYRYIELYHLYCLLSCFELFNDINSLECKDYYNMTKAEFHDEIAAWRRDYPKYRDDFNRIDLEIRESVIKSIIGHYSHMALNWYHDNTLVLCDMKIDNMSYVEEENKNVYKYMLYYLVPEYEKDEYYKSIFEKVSETMLEELDPFVEDKVKLDIEEVANDHLINKGIKKGI